MLVLWTIASSQSSNSAETVAPLFAGQDREATFNARPHSKTERCRNHFSVWPATFTRRTRLHGIHTPHLQKPAGSEHDIKTGGEVLSEGPRRLAGSLKSWPLFSLPPRRCERLKPQVGDTDSP